MARFLKLWTSVFFAALISRGVLFGAAKAHEVQPAVMDLEITPDTITLHLDWTLEAAVADLNLEGLADTNAAENAEAYDDARALAPDALAEAFREAWPRMREGMTINA